MNIDVGNVRVILIGGRSHAGKSTVARYLADQLGWDFASTDTLARHPGRPWGEVPEHVAAHYTGLSDSAILEALLVHQRGMWPLIEARIRENLSEETPGLVLEGSALMPAQVGNLRDSRVGALWLTGNDAFFRQRIEAASGYPAADVRRRVLIDRFIERNHRLDAVLRDEAKQFDLPVVDVDGASVAEMASRCWEAVQRARSGLASP